MPTETLVQYYKNYVSLGRIHDDPAQRSVLVHLENLRTALTPNSSIKRLWNKNKPKGLYIWGNVGRGKSMLMDLFFDHAPEPRKRRLHFHVFMQQMHAGIHRLRQQGVADPVMHLAAEIADSARLLCFDELQANDVTDASLLFRLFSGLFDAGTVIVATSNHPPSSLYTGGLQAERFQKFIELLESRMNVLSLSSPEDYRLLRQKSLQQTYFYPLGPSADNFIEEALHRLAPGDSGHDAQITVHGRQLAYKQYGESIGYADFEQLCKQALGAADYLALSEMLDTIIIPNIPLLTPEMRNEARRFVILIDALYEQKVRLYCTAAAAPEALYPQGDGSFEFKRTVSRLMEMQSAGWGKTCIKPDLF